MRKTRCRWTEQDRMGVEGEGKGKGRGSCLVWSSRVWVGREFGEIPGLGLDVCRWIKVGHVSFEVRSTEYGVPALHYMYL